VTERQKLGTEGENAAEAHLRKQGFRVIERNWRHGSYELDIICKDKQELVFVEVRTRTSQGMTAPRETISPQKQNKIIKAARLYLAESSWDGPCRFDVIAIIANDATFEVEHIRHAFDTSDTVDSRHAAW